MVDFLITTRFYRVPFRGLGDAYALRFATPENRPSQSSSQRLIPARRLFDVTSSRWSTTLSESAAIISFPGRQFDEFLTT